MDSVHHIWCPLSSQEYQDLPDGAETTLTAIATFEREMMLERQAEGIALARLKGKYKGRKATAMCKSEEVRDLVKKGVSKPEISRQLGIGITSIYRIIRDKQAGLLNVENDS
ncbi:hypothetical protein [Klebsiella pneumoniae]|uniref:hypothetical protein n=1 Tax=Klebsiella pneumoniae TaxID=573 RepID=UPI0020B10790|nr:hypothetical protein [Klebsiella pneumoniae]